MIISAYKKKKLEKVAYVAIKAAAFAMLGFWMGTMFKASLYVICDHENE